MISRIILYLVKNFSKLIPTFILFIVSITIISTLSYVVLTIFNVKNNEVNNYVNVSTNFNQTEFVTTQAKDYDAIYDSATASGKVASHRFDFSFQPMFILDTEINSVHLMYDENEIDFLNEINSIVEGKYSNNGVLISSKAAEKYKLEIGDKIDAVSLAYINQSSMFEQYQSESSSFVITKDSLIQGAPVTSIEITGIYTSTDYSKISSSSMFGGVGNADSDIGPIYVGNVAFSTYENEAAAGKEIIAGLIPEEQMFTVDSTSMQRFLIEYKSNEEANTFVNIMEKDTRFSTTNSYDEYKEAVKPLNNIFSGFVVAFVIAIVFVAISIYLNNYLLVEKRRNEIISLLTFGVSKFKLGIQSVIEMFIVLITCLPFGFLATKFVSPIILDVVKQYYVVTVKKGLDTGNDSIILGGNGDLPYYNVDTDNLISFNSTSLSICLIIAFLISFIIISVLTYAEMRRNIKTIGRM